MPTMEADTLIADKLAPAKAGAFDDEARVLEPLAAAGKTAVIPPRVNRSSPRDYDRQPLWRASSDRELLRTDQAVPRSRHPRSPSLGAGEAGPEGEDRAERPGRRPPRRQHRSAQLMTVPRAFQYRGYQSDY
jgi:hypothetical protein